MSEQSHSSTSRTPLMAPVLLSVIWGFVGEAFSLAAEVPHGPSIQYPFPRYVTRTIDDRQRGVSSHFFICLLLVLLFVVLSRLPVLPATIFSSFGHGSLLFRVELPAFIIYVVVLLVVLDLLHVFVQ